MKWLKLLLILLTVSTLASCKLSPTAPQWPSHVKAHFSIWWDENGEAACYAHEIISTDPYIVENPIKLNDVRACNGLSGYLPKETADVINYKNQTYEWMRDILARKK